MRQGQSPPDPGASMSELRRFAAALQAVGRGGGVDEALQLSVDLAVELIAGVDSADVMLVQDGEITVPVATDGLARRVDEVQRDTGEGPCLTALRTGESDRVLVADLRDDERWPAFRTEALALGVRSIHAFRLFRAEDGTDVLGALNLFGREPNGQDLAVALGQVFAAHCSVMLRAEIERAGLREALRSRDLIGQAKGILMERHKLTADEAFQLLRDASSTQNVKIRDLAEQVTQTGSLPD